MKGPWKNLSKALTVGGIALEVLWLFFLAWLGCSVILNQPLPLKSGTRANHDFSIVLCLLVCFVQIIRIRGDIKTAVKTMRNNRRVERGECIHCGYSLHATPERCPECGAVPKKNPVST